MLTDPLFFAGWRCRHPFYFISFILMAITLTFTRTQNLEFAHVWVIWFPWRPHLLYGCIWNVFCCLDLFLRLLYLLLFLSLSLSFRTGTGIPRHITFTFLISFLVFLLLVSKPFSRFFLLYSFILFLPNSPLFFEATSFSLNPLLFILFPTSNYFHLPFPISFGPFILAIVNIYLVINTI